MKISLIMLIALSLFSSCGGGTRKYVSNDETFVDEDTYLVDTIPIMPHEQEKTKLNPGIKKEYIPQSKKEKLICKVLKDYFEYAINGMYEKCVQSTYVDVFTYIQQQFPNMTMQEIKQNFAKMHKDMDFRGILDYTIEYLGMEDGEIIISSIKECVREGNKLIYIGYTVTQFYGTYDYYTTPADPMLIISLDDGNSWELATPSVDVPNILEYKFSRQSVEKVLNDMND